MDAEIVTKRAKIAEFVKTVQQRADTERNALGFLPSAAYTEAAAQEKLLVAVVIEGDNKRYAGHLMFGGTFPNGRIFQVYVDPAFRNRRIGEKLVEAVIRRSESEHYLSLKANVASDLHGANEFWQRMGFDIALVKSGGLTTGRTINVRVRDLKVPSLLSLLGDLHPEVRDDLGLVSSLSHSTPLYVLDLNVLFDITKGRTRSSQAGRLIAAACKNMVRLAISEEFIRELRRNSANEAEDPILRLVLELPQLALPTDQELKSYAELGEILFPARHKEGRLTIQDKSDIRHLATVIHHGASGFVTSENAILNARSTIRSKFGVDVVGLEEFTFSEEPYPDVDFELAAVAAKGARIEAHDLRTGDISQVSQFLKNIRIPQQIITQYLEDTQTHKSSRQTVITSDKCIVAFGSWNRTLGLQRNAKIFVCTDETHPLCETAVDFLLNRACIDLSGAGPSLLTLDDLPGRVTTRRLAIAQGFRPQGTDLSNQRLLQKLCVGRPITPANWSITREQIKSISGVVLPEFFPKASAPDDKLTITNKSGRSILIAVRDLEKLMSPVLFLFQSRYGALVPIRKPFADELLGTSDQRSFLDSREASLLSERAYFCTTRAANTLKPGTSLLFYESGERGGRSSVVAVGRSVESDILLKTDVPTAVGRRGVLDDNVLNRITADKHILATRFDNVMRLPNPVPFNQLKTIGAVDGSNLVTARRVDGKTFLKIVSRGWSND